MISTIRVNHDHDYSHSHDHNLFDRSDHAGMDGVCTVFSTRCGTSHREMTAPCGTTASHQDRVRSVHRAGAPATVYVQYTGRKALLMKPWTRTDISVRGTIWIERESQHRFRQGNVHRVNGHVLDPDRQSSDCPKTRRITSKTTDTENTCNGV